MLTIVFIISSAFLVQAKSGFGWTEQNWGFVKVREKAHMFWWLYYTNATTNYSSRPLVIWLQGGPGGSSTGIGNFNEIGPLDIDQQKRNISWDKYLNVLFVDNPVGTGFSYVEENDSSLFAMNNTAIAQDFLAFLKGFLSENPEFEDVPTYIFGQSYGGKMTADIALLLHQEHEAGNIKCNIKGIGLGDAWISPIDSLETWGPYLYNLGFIDADGLGLLTTISEYVRDLVDEGRYDNATRYFQLMQIYINSLTTVDYYNVMKKKTTCTLRNSDWNEQFDSFLIAEDLLKNLKLKHSDLHGFVSRSVSLQNDDTLYSLMNGPVVNSLNLSSNLPIQWGDQSDYVFRAVDQDFMKPVTEVVERILNETDIEVTVYTGQLDLIVDTPGTNAWIEKLNWIDADKWKSSNRTPIVLNNIYEGYEKRYQNFNYYWIHRAGHAVPSDNPETMEYILRQATHNYNIN